MVETNTHPRKFVVRGPTAPENPFGGQVWLDTSGQNVEMNQYDASGPNWELVIARGPDTPEHPVEGSLWTDTTTQELKQYENGAWQNTSVTNHANLSNVTKDQHRTDANILMTVAGALAHGDLTDVQKGQHRSDANIRGVIDGANVSIAGDADTVDGQDAAALSDEVTTTVPTDVSSSRSTGVWYQNTTGSPLRVYVTVDAGSGNKGDIRLHVSNDQSDNRILWQSAGTRASGTVLVPDEAYYKAVKFSGNDLRHWREQEVSTE